MTALTGRKPDLQRIVELREKIRDEKYVEYAIMRIAQVLSNKLLDIDGECHERR